MAVFNYLNKYSVVKKKDEIYVIDLDTGEKITDLKEAYDKIKKFQIDNGFRDGSKALGLIGYDEEYFLYHKKSKEAIEKKNKQNTWRAGNKFNKLFRDKDIEKLFEDLSPVEAGVLTKLMILIDFNTNRVKLKNNMPIYKQDLDVYLKLSRNSINGVLKILQEKNIINFEDKRNFIDIYINPDICTYSSDLDKETVKRFKKVDLGEEVND